MEERIERLERMVRELLAIQLMEHDPPQNLPGLNRFEGPWNRTCEEDRKSYRKMADEVGR